jgi:hypothetical protein
VIEDYRDLTSDELELVEKSSLRTVVQALQQYSREAREIFENTPAKNVDTEVTVLAEDLTQYALSVAETYPIDVRYAGWVDYKQARWFPTIYGLMPQVLLVDAKANKENNRTTLQKSQLPMNAEFESEGVVYELDGEVGPHMEIAATNGTLEAVTTSIFVHFYYRSGHVDPDRYRTLFGMYAMCVPHRALKAKYNPNPQTTFFGQGKHSPTRGEDPRIRIYFSRLRQACAWRLQELYFEDGYDYSIPRWRDYDDEGNETVIPFEFIGR